jgi:hypothetical protein
MSLNFFRSKKMENFLFIIYVGVPGFLFIIAAIIVYLGG